MSFKHQYESTVANTPSEKVSSDRWNAPHIFKAGDEPADDDVAEGTAVPYMSDVDGSIKVKIKFGGVVKTGTILPFPLLS